MTEMTEMDVDCLPIPPAGFSWQLEVATETIRRVFPDGHTESWRETRPNLWTLKLVSPEEDVFWEKSLTDLTDASIVLNANWLLHDYQSRNRKKLLEDGPVSLYRTP